MKQGLSVMGVCTIFCHANLCNYYNNDMFNILVYNYVYICVWACGHITH